MALGALLHASRMLGRDSNFRPHDPRDAHWRWAGRPPEGNGTNPGLGLRARREHNVLRRRWAPEPRFLRPLRAQHARSVTLERCPCEAAGRWVESTVRSGLCPWARAAAPAWVRTQAGGNGGVWSLAGGGVVWPGLDRTRLKRCPIPWAELVKAGPSLAKHKPISGQRRP